MANLRVWFHEIPVGTLTLTTNGRWDFQYEKDWICKKLFAISPHLPLKENLVPDLAHNKTVEWFFDNLLPEGLLREKLAKEASIVPADTWGFLAKYGHEGPGALSVLPDTQHPDKNESLTPLSPLDLQQMILASKNGKPLMAAKGVTKMSLPGTQEKMTLRFANGEFFLPQGAATSTHILKPENILYPFCPVNEWFSMTLARNIGLKASQVHLLTLPDHERVFIVERYDRRKTDQRIERIHQVDLCQASNVSPNSKYESYGGLDSKNLFGVSGNCDVPAIANQTSMQWLVFNYLIGNNDAHAKNISFFMGAEKLKPTPFYDLLCVEACIAEQDLAMSIGGEIKAGCVEGCHWDAAALLSNLNPRSLRLIINDLTKRIAKELPNLANSPIITGDEQMFVNDKILPVIQQRTRFVQDAIKAPPILKGELLPADRIDPSVIKQVLSSERSGDGGLFS